MKYNTEDIIFELLWQECGVLQVLSMKETGRYIDNKCMSCYEEACSYLKSKGYLKTKNGRIYDFTKKGLKILMGRDE